METVVREGPRPSTGAAASAAEAVAVIRSGMRVFVHGGSAYPAVLMEALAAREDIQGVELVHLHLNGTPPPITPESAGRLRHRALFIDPSTRDAVADGLATYVPAFLSDVPRLFTNGHLPLDAALLHLSPPDEHGYCSLGTSVDCALAAARTARILIAQINPQMPRTHGDSFVHINSIHHWIEVDEPLPEAPVPSGDGVSHAIGRRIAELVPDGATLQLGIGAIPNAVLAELRDRRDLGIHSEVISDGILDLVERGVITGARKTLNRGKIVVAFLNGTRRLYDFADDNPMLEMRGADYTNESGVIQRIDDMIAVNAAVEIDLTGQVCAESIGHRIFSGVGGQMDFIRGAALARRGRPIIALPSTAKGGAISRIVPALQPGAGVTTTRAHVHWIVTEHGRVNLHGMDLAERARALIRLADPRFRHELSRAARDLHLLSPRLFPGFTGPDGRPHRRAGDD